MRRHVPVELTAPSSMKLAILSTRSLRHLSASVPNGMAKKSKHRPSMPSSQPTMRLLPSSCAQPTSAQSWHQLQHPRAH